MKLDITLILFALSALSNALPHPENSPDVLESRDEIAALGARHAESSVDVNAPAEELWKRKGGGGAGGRGGGGGGTTSSGGSSSGGSSSGGSSTGSSGSLIPSSSSSGRGSSSHPTGSSSGTSSGSGARTGSGSSSSTSGGRTTTGSGVQPSYGRGYYGGGASVPYAAGGRSASGISPLFLGAGIATVAYLGFSSIWLYGVYAYPYSHPYSFYNRTANRNMTKPVQCLCQEYAECGCDEPGDTSQLDQLVGDGNYNSLNKSVVTVNDVDGTSTILINGTLENGTTASGGTDSASGSSASSMLQMSGFSLVAALVGCMVLLT
jgi:hypothetical protein